MNHLLIVTFNNASELFSTGLNSSPDGESRSERRVTQTQSLEAIVREALKELPCFDAETAPSNDNQFVKDSPEHKEYTNGVYKAGFGVRRLNSSFQLFVDFQKNAQMLDAERVLRAKPDLKVSRNGLGAHALG